MEELLQQILSTLQDIDRKLGDLKGIGLYTSISDVYDKLDEIYTKME